MPKYGTLVSLRDNIAQESPGNTYRKLRLSHTLVVPFLRNFCQVVEPTGENVERMKDSHNRSAGKIE